MNSEYSTPARSQQHSPAPFGSQQSACSETQMAMSAAYGLAPPAPLDLPPTAVDVSNAQLAFIKNAYPDRPFSPTAMSFANMNIASGYPTPHSATPVAMQSQTTQPQGVSLEGAAASASAAQAPSAEKPDFSYASLIAQSLVDAPMQRRTLNGIYEWIQEHFPYYRTRQNWQNSIRHNLSLNKGFMKIKRDEAHPGKGSFWTFTPGYESCLNGGHFKPIRSRSGRAALAAAAAMAAANASGSPSANDVATGSESDARLAAQSTADEKSSKKGEKKTVRAIKSAKSLKRSYSVPPKENSAPPPQGAGDTAAASITASDAASLAMAGMSECMIPGPLVHSDTAPAGIVTGRNATKKMRVSSSQSHGGIASISTTFSNVSMVQYPQTPSFAPSPAPYMASPALMSANSMSVASTASHTPLNQPAQFQFHMPSPCSMPLPISAMDLASIPANNASGPYGIGSAFVGPHTTQFGDAASGTMTPLFGDVANTNDPLYAARRTNMPPRISWHGSESMNQAFNSLHHPGQQPCQVNSLGVTMGPESMDIGLTMLGDGHNGICMANDGTVNASPMDWAMLAGMSAPQAMSADMAMNTPQLHHMSSISTIDATSSGPQSQQRSVDVSHAETAAAAVAATTAEANGGQGIMALYDEVLRDSSSLMNVFGQDMSGWQCPTKTNTIDPAALCAVDPDTSSL
ncbi:Forkhead box protein L1 [Coemansia brasiliensis]|uniref:Forkhead box protein L1 n=1 Tax=Coemansia brasiliensis TaxID=2650707 RepID=A0A9W8M1N8_9FUNG|nr:Forkhead box protein L1 [Coemansia brasiliensis]